MTTKTDENVFETAENTSKAKAAPKTTKAKETKEDAKTDIDEVLKTESVSKAEESKPTKAPAVGRKAPVESDEDADMRERLITRLETIGAEYDEDATVKELVAIYADKMEQYSKSVKPEEIEDLVRDYNREQGQRLVRISMTCMNQMKSSLKGEYFTVGNRTVGVIKKFIPYNTEAMAIGWHVPLALYHNLKERVFFPPNTKQNKFGMDEPVNAAQKEFNIVVLPPLTQEEIDEIAKHQRANNTVNRA